MKPRSATSPDCALPGECAPVTSRCELHLQAAPYYRYAPMSDPALVQLSLSEAAAMLRRRRISPVELAEAVLTRAAALNPTLNAFTTLVPPEQVLAAAR